MKIIRAATVPTSLLLFCKGLLRELSRKYEVIALSSAGPELEEIYNKEGVRCIEVPMCRHISVWNDLVSLFWLIRVFRKEKPDMVHSITPKAGLLCMVSAFLTGVPVRVHTFTGLIWPTAKGIKRHVLKLTDRITCSCATHIIPEGLGVKNDLMQITNKPMRILGYGNIRGVDMAYFDRTPETLANARGLMIKNCFTFIFVGRLVGDKGVKELVTAFAKVNEIHTNTRLLLIGGSEEDLDPLDHNTIEIINSHPAIIRIGFQSDVRPYYAVSDCFVLPSYREGFPNTVLEAGAFGLPCIVTDINGSREIIKNGYNGLVVPPHSTDDLYIAMKRMIDNPKERMSMASVARDHIASHYEQSFVRKCLYDFYHEVLRDN